MNDGKEDFADCKLKLIAVLQQYQKLIIVFLSYSICRHK